MKTITFSSLKGGTAKTTLSILTANFLSSAGYKILVIDMDVQNSLSFYYLDSPDIIDEKNIAFAFQRQTLLEDTVPSNYPGIDIIPSSFNLVDLRAVHTGRLKKLLSTVENKYDFCIIDTAPTYDNLVLNALNASDLIITPARLSQFDYKSLLFYQEKLLTETDKLENWKIILTFYQPPRSDNGENITNQYLTLFHSTFTNILPFQIPTSLVVQKTIDAKEVLSNSQKKVKVFQPIKKLAEYIAENLLEVARC